MNSKAHKQQLRLFKGEDVFENHGKQTVATNPQAIDEPQDDFFLGLDYVVDFLNSYVKCFLCNYSTMKQNAFLKHLNSANHQLSYLNVHFPSLYKFIADFEAKGKQLNSCFININTIKLQLLKIVRNSIRDHCGDHLQARQVNQFIESANHIELQGWISMDSHFYEANFPQLRNILNEGLVKDMLLHSFYSLFPNAEESERRECNTNYNPWQMSPPHEQFDYKDNARSQGADDIDFNSGPTASGSFSANSNKHEVQISCYELLIMIENFTTLNYAEQQSLSQYLKAMRKFEPQMFHKLRNSLNSAGSQTLDFILQYNCV